MAREDATNRVTIYRLKQRVDLQVAELEGLRPCLVCQDNATQLEYALWFIDSELRNPAWFPLFQRLDVETPQTKNAGFVLLINSEEATYACTGGNGHHYLLREYQVLHRFGISLAKKLLSDQDIAGLGQKDTIGAVYNLERVFRAKYKPAWDTANLHRVLSTVRGKFSKTNPKYREIGSSIKACDSLSVTKSRTLPELLKFVLKIDEINDNDEYTLDIPELEQLSKKHDSDLLDRLNMELAKTLQQYMRTTAAPPSLYLDNAEVGYLPDRVEEYELCVGRVVTSCTTIEECFCAISSSLSEVPDDMLYEKIAKMRIRLVFDDGESSPHLKLVTLLCGDVVVNDEAYFINAGRWYCVSAAFMARVNEQLNTVPIADPSEYGLPEWRNVDDEGDYNLLAEQVGLLLLDKHLVRIDGENGGIELCDLLFRDDDRFALIHVKHACGARLRALFAQAYVAAQLYAEENEFKDKVHNADLTSRASLTDETVSSLKELGNAQLRDMQIVLAIYDDTISHVMERDEPVNLCDYMGKTLTLFAKVDLLHRVQGLRSLGYDIAVTRIRPYPSRNAQ